MKIRFILNDKDIIINTDPMRRLLDVLRDDLQAIDVKESCGEGECGACTVLLNGKPVTSCLINVIQADGGIVQTASGLVKTPLGKIIQESFEKTNAVQCGFCFPGFLVTTYHFLQTTPSGESSLIKRALSGNICRCTGYKKIIEAVQLAYDKLKGREGYDELL